MPKVLVQHLGHRGQAVRGATGVGDAEVLGRDLVVVDAEDAGQVGLLGRGADDHLLGPCLQVGIEAGLGLPGLRVGPLALGESAGALDDHLGLEVLPRELGGVALGHDRDGLAIDDQALGVVLHGAGEAAVDAVVLQQGRQRGHVGDVVDPDHLEYPRLGHQTAEHQPADPSKSIDTHTNCHVTPPLGMAAPHKSWAAVFLSVNLCRSAGPDSQNADYTGNRPATRHCGPRTSKADNTDRLTGAIPTDARIERHLFVGPRLHTRWRCARGCVGRCRPAGRIS